MKSLLGGKKNPEQQAREAIRKKKWTKALDYYRAQLKTRERDYALWNLIGDLQMNNKQRTDALESWRKAMDGYFREGLYENTLGVARKVLRFAPEEEDVYLVMSGACRELEYIADCIGTFRTYMKTAKRRSESDMRNWFKKMCDLDHCHPHLAEELAALYNESKIDDIELDKMITHFVEEMTQKAMSPSNESDIEELAPSVFEPEMPSEPEPLEMPRAGLTMLGNVPMNGQPHEDYMSGFGSTPPGFHDAPNLQSEFETANFEVKTDLPAGEGKDHYDLGVVYTEMKLWDAAISEFENARRDPTVRHQATLGLAHCYQATNDLQKALDLLESEQQGSETGTGANADIKFQLGVVHELLGNMDEALQCFEQIRGRTTSLGNADMKIEEIKSRLASSN